MDPEILAVLSDLSLMFFPGHQDLHPYAALEILCPTPTIKSSSDYQLPMRSFPWEVIELLEYPDQSILIHMKS